MEAGAIEEFLEQFHNAHFVMEHFVDILDFFITPKIIMFFAIVFPIIIIHSNSIRIATLLIFIFIIYSILVSFSLFYLVDHSLVCDKSEDPLLDVLFAVFVKLPFGIFLSVWPLYALAYIFTIVININTPESEIHLRPTRRIAISLFLTIVLILSYSTLFIVSSYLYGYLVC
jgi:hypothetical protein